MTKQKTANLLLLIICVIVIGMLHWVTPGDKVFLHELYRRLNYFPIVVGALLYGMRAGLILAFCTIVAFIPHLHHFYLMGRDFYLSELTEIILYIAAGVVTGTIATQEKKARKQYQELSQKLERSYKRLHDQTEVLLAVEEQLRSIQKLSALGELSASLAHEIKNPLASIRGTAEIFLDEFPVGHPKREFVEILLKETTRLSKNVDEVLQFSKQQNMTASHKPNPEPLLDTITRVATLLENKLYKKGITLITDIPDTVTDYPVDGDKMSQVLINLLLNSYEAVDPQGKIWLKVEKRAHAVAMVVEDNGPGIPADEQEKVFLPFFSNREDGTGLGLAISSRIVESFGGSITVDSRPDGGARFTVLLPFDNNKLSSSGQAHE